MIYELEFHPLALKEWKNLSETIREQFKKKLCQRLENPKVPKDKLSGLDNVYKIKLKSAGFRLAYRVEEDRVIVIVLAVGKRENNSVYKLLHSRV